MNNLGSQMTEQLIDSQITKNWKNSIVLEVYNLRLKVKPVFGNVDTEEQVVSRI